MTLDRVQPQSVYLRADLLVVDGHVESHYPGCRCTTTRMWWPCSVEETADARA